MTNYKIVLVTVVAVCFGFYFADLGATKVPMLDSAAKLSASETQKTVVLSTVVSLPQASSEQLVETFERNQYKQQPVKTADPESTGQIATTKELTHTNVDAHQFMLAKISGRTWTQQDRFEFMDHFAKVDDTTREQMLSMLSARLNDGTLQLEGGGAAF